LSRDQVYGGLILAVSAILVILYLAAFLVFPKATFLGWAISWWAIVIPVSIFVLGVLVVCVWIGWTMATTPPPAPIETEEVSKPAEAEEKPKE